MDHLLQLTLSTGACAAAALSLALPQDAPVLATRTELVTLSVTVVDRQGAFVPDLRREHFTVYDEGTRRSIQFFARAVSPSTIGILIDSSGSMRGRKVDLAHAVSALASPDHPDDEFFTLHFNERVWPGLPAATAFTRDTARLHSALLAAPARGMTALYDAVQHGLHQVARGSGAHKALILVSDGGDNASAVSFDAIVSQARRTNAVIHSITYFDPDNREARPGVLKALARETGGSISTVENRVDLARAFDRIGADIRGGYTIGFVPEDTPVTRYRSVRVFVDAGDGRHLSARTRAGYHAGPTSAVD